MVRLNISENVPFEGHCPKGLSAPSPRHAQDEGRLHHRALRFVHE